jgi:hypothetical protein
MFVLDEWDRLTPWRRVEIHFNHSVLATVFPAPLLGGGPLTASVQVVTEQNRERILERLDGMLTLDGDRVYFELAPKPST